MKKPRIGTAVAIVVAGGIVVAAANAAIIATSGAAQQIAPPASVELGALESNTTAFAFDEQQDVALAGDVTADIVSPGTYDDFSDLTPTVIAAGTKVRSHLVHADRIGKKTKKLVLDGSVTVDRDVLGIVVQNSTLDASDVLGAPGTAYPGAEDRGLSFDKQEDSVTLAADKRTVTFHLQLKRHSDQIRIITRGPICRKEEEESTDDDSSSDDSKGDGSSDDSKDESSHDGSHDGVGADHGDDSGDSSHGDSSHGDTTGDDCTGDDSKDDSSHDESEHSKYDD